MQPLKIAIVPPFERPVLRDAEQGSLNYIIYNLVFELVRDGYDVFYFGPGDTDPAVKRHTHYTEIFQMSLSVHPSYKNDRSNNGLIIGATRALKLACEHEVDIIHNLAGWPLEIIESPIPMLTGSLEYLSDIKSMTQGYVDAYRATIKQLQNA